jgi:hypothetical protein
MKTIGLIFIAALILYILYWKMEPRRQAAPLANAGENRKFDPLFPERPLIDPVILEINFPRHKVRLRVNRSSAENFNGLHNYFHLFRLPNIFATGKYDLDIGNGFGRWSVPVLNLIFNSEICQDLAYARFTRDPEIGTWHYE